MTNSQRSQSRKACVIALHCSLGSGRQWSKLSGALAPDYQLIAPEISGYGEPRGDATGWPTRLAEEVAWIEDCLDQTAGPLHLVGHSYGGAIAFKIATSSRFAPRLRSLTLIEPVLPTLLRDNDADRRLLDGFAELALDIYVDLWRGAPSDAIGKFLCYWKGSGPAEELPREARLRMVDRADKIAFDFSAIFAEEDVSAAAAALSAPTLLVSGGLSPALTQRVTERLASTIAGAKACHLPEAAHMVPVTHAKLINPEIVAHIRRTDQIAETFARALTAAWR
jgi:pimeloyl-ACP methyl ester carboxylesterase